MIRPSYFIEKLRENGIDCFAGVPDSLLKNICAYITDHFDAAHNIIAANEGAAVGLAAGHYLATGQPACVWFTVLWVAYNHSLKPYGVKQTNTKYHVSRS